MKGLNLILALVLVQSASVYAQDWTLKPITGFGPLLLGMTPSQVETFLEPTEVIGPADEPLFVKYSEQLTCQFEAGKVTLISLHENSLITKQGSVTVAPYKRLSIGESWRSAVIRIPGPKKTSQLLCASRNERYQAYLELGLGVRTKNGIVVQVDLWKPNQTAASGRALTRLQTPRSSPSKAPQALSHGEIHVPESSERRFLPVLFVLWDIF